MEMNVGDPYAAARERMIEEHLRGRGIVMRRVLDAMRAIPRHLFVSHELQEKAYADEALPTKEGQSISQPFIVAAMTQDLDVREGMRVLELGTGTGYQTAVLAQLVGEPGRVYTIERMASLGNYARSRLDAMGITNVRYFVGDGSAGWPANLWHDCGEVLFDRIMVTAGAPGVPGPLVQQLKPGGVMVVPVGNGESQVLRRVVKRADGAVKETESLRCRFVPLLGEFAWDSEPGRSE